MNDKMNYSADDCADDLNNLGEEVTADAERALDETTPKTFDEADWNGLRKAIKTMRENLDYLERLIDEKAEEAAEHADDGEDETDCESYWG